MPARPARRLPDFGVLDAPQLPDAGETSGKILVRVPKTLHAALLSEAEQKGTSLNQLIVSKLSLQLRAAV